MGGVTSGLLAASLQALFECSNGWACSYSILKLVPLRDSPWEEKMFVTVGASTYMFILMLVVGSGAGICRYKELLSWAPKSLVEIIDSMFHRTEENTHRPENNIFISVFI